MKGIIMVKVSKSKQSNVLAALAKGKSLTPAQISGVYGLANPHDAIMNLRRQGHCIYTNKRTIWDGRVSTSYRIGTPSKAMVAATATFGGSAFFG